MPLPCLLICRFFMLQPGGCMQRQAQRGNGAALLADVQLKSAPVALGDALQDLQPVAVPRLLLGGF